MLPGVKMCNISIYERNMCADLNASSGAPKPTPPADTININITIKTFAIITRPPKQSKGERERETVHASEPWSGCICLWHRNPDTSTTTQSSQTTRNRAKQRRCCTNRAPEWDITSVIEFGAQQSSELSATTTTMSTTTPSATPLHV